MSKHRAPKARSYVRGPHIYQHPNGVWYGRDSTRPDGWSLRTRDRATAEATFRTQLAAPDQPLAGPVALTLADCAREWLDAPHGYTRRTLASHRERIKAFGLWAHAQRITHPIDLTPEVIDRWITERSATVSRRTINRDLRTLKVCLRWCAARGHCAEVVAVSAREVLREPKRRRRAVVPSPVEFARVLDQITSTDLRSVLLVLYATGLRIEELRRLAVGDLHDGKVWVRPELGPAATAEPSKGYRERAIPVSDLVATEVKAVLAWKTGKRGHTAHKHQLHRALHAACDAARVPRCGLHDLRRAFATECTRAKIPLATVSRWLGHQLTSTTEAYVADYRTDADLVAPTPTVLSEASESLPKAGSIPVLSGPRSVLNVGQGLRRGNNGNTGESNPPPAAAKRRGHRF